MFTLIGDIPVDFFLCGAADLFLEVDVDEVVEREVLLGMTFVVEIFLLDSINLFEAEVVVVRTDVFPGI